MVGRWEHRPGAGLVWSGLVRSRDVTTKYGYDMPVSVVERALDDGGKLGGLSSSWAYWAVLKHNLGEKLCMPFSRMATLARLIFISFPGTVTVPSNVADEVLGSLCEPRC